MNDLIHDGRARDGGFVEPRKNIGLMSGDELTLRSDWGLIDVLGRSLPDGIDARQLVGRRQWWLIGGIPLPICQLDDLIEVKTRVGRQSDLADVALLRVARRGR